jgi:UDP-N-acetylmuramoylalanine--D-glutamate ligase
MHDWKDRKVLVLGLGDTGLSMTRWLTAHGARVTVADTRSNPPHANAVRDLAKVTVETGAFQTRAFDNADAIAISPGIDRRQPLVQRASRRGIPVVGDIEIFSHALRALTDARSAPHPKVIGITGSNGKSTVTAMTGEVARAAGNRTLVAGNIGIPVLDALTDIENGGESLPDTVVLELSSFQLESTSSLNADAASVLNVTEDHLDRYEGMADYAAAKARIFQGDGVQVLNRDDAWSMQMGCSTRRTETFGLSVPGAQREWGLHADSVLGRGAERLMPIGELQVAGLHNAGNALAALALGDAIGLPTAAMLEGLRRFSGLPHRLEKVAEIGGVTFYNDSKGTNVGATVAALNGMTRRVVLIAGGDGKGQDFSPLASPIAAHARAIVLIGRDAPRIESAIASAGAVRLHAQSLEEAVALAYRASDRGDAVLLSPACASYDMFRSYVHRGEVFVEAVRALAAREAGGSAT